MAEGALGDIRVVEWGESIPAPYAGKLLGDLGAEVIKVEPPGGDIARRLGPFPGDIPHQEKSGLFLVLNTSKLGITLSVDTATGLGLLKRLVAGADVFLCGARPSRIEGLGLDFESLHALNPRLVATYITPFGLTGPDRDFQTTDLVTAHMSGYAREAAPPTDDPSTNPPIRPGGHQADFVAGLAAAAGTMAALAQRAATGVGDYVDVSEVEALTTFVYPKLATLSYEQRVPTRYKADAGPRGSVWVLPCRDGWVAISPREEHQWTRWLEVMGNPEWGQNPRFTTRAARAENNDDLVEQMSAWSRTQGKQEIVRNAQERRVAAFAMNTAEDLFASEHYMAREFFVDVDHPVAGTFRYPSAPYRLSETPWAVRRPAPTLGEDNEAVLCGRLGLSRAALVKLRATGVI